MTPAGWCRRGGAAGVLAAGRIGGGLCAEGGRVGIWWRRQVVSNTCLYYEYNRLKHHFLVAKLCYTLVF